MKKICTIFIWLFLHNYSFCQTKTTAAKLYEISKTIGVYGLDSTDYVSFGKSEEPDNKKVGGQIALLLEGAEYYMAKDYQNSIFHLQKINYKFKYSAYNNLKFVVLIESCVRLNDIKNTAKYFYLMNKSKFVDPDNKKLVRTLIGNGFNKNSFDAALSRFYYYHDRQKILNDIKFVK